MCEPTTNYGQICWLEIPVSDVVRASKFYTDIFGWECSPDAMPIEEKGVKSMHFFTSPEKKLCGAFLLQHDGYQMGTYGKLDKEILPPMPTFCVKDCDETLQRVKILGGSAHCPKTAIGGEMGHYARFYDSEGNIIGVWSKK